MQLRFATEVRAMVRVHTEHRGRSVGRLLLELVLRLAEGRDIAGIVNGDEHSVAVGDHWGFVRERQHQISSIDPSKVPPPPVTPDDLRVVPLDAIEPARVWACLQEVATDDPSGQTQPLPLEEVIDTHWLSPAHRLTSAGPPRTPTERSSPSRRSPPRTAGPGTP